MENKKYSSYAEIELELQILKIEREIHYQRILLGIEKTKESVVPTKAISLLGNIYDKVFSGAYGIIIKTAIPIFINWYINRKRGD
ncbi:DUF6327 family protein [Flavobacterium sp. RSB2_4_14]|uniref:DUF6327 family protein n=1 Tax=Flavobacterium sp. RSB2_4_14 TaxID=3447665 RepID=UPI003F3C12D3